MALPQTGTETIAPGDVTVRRVKTLAEYDECVSLQRETWGDKFTDMVPSTLLKISQEMGGVTAAAFAPDGSMLGFVYGMTGIRNGKLAHWSDMLAVRPKAQGLGLGTRLKHYQRELLLEIGAHTMYWTYDPLVARNAHLNLERLGARVVEYRVNFYGADTGSVVHSALGTDRFIVAWDLTQPLRKAAPERHWPQDVVIVNAIDSGSGKPVIEDLPGVPAVRVAVPDDIFAVLDRDPAVAHAWRDTTQRAFLHYLNDGYEVVGIQRSTAGQPATYYLQRTNTPRPTHT